MLSVAYSPDGTKLVSGSLDGTARVWDAGTGGELKVLGGHAGKVWAVAFGPDGKRVASASQDGTVRLRDAGGAGP